MLAVRVGTIGVPKTIDIPFGKLGFQDFGMRQGVSVDHEPGSVSAHLNMHHPPDDMPSYYWSEIRASSMQAVLLDANGAPLSTTMSNFTFESAGSAIYTLKLTAQNEPSAVRVRGYAFEDSYGARRIIPPLLFEVPRR